MGKFVKALDKKERKGKKESEKLLPVKVDNSDKSISYAPYNDIEAEKLLIDIATKPGSLNAICQANGYKDAQFLNYWKITNILFKDMLNKALEFKADCDIQDIENCIDKADTEIDVSDISDRQKQLKLHALNMRIQHRKWHAGKWNERYADKPALNQNIVIQQQNGGERVSAWKEENIGNVDT